MALISGASNSRVFPVATSSTTLVSGIGFAWILDCMPATGSVPKLQSDSPALSSRMAASSSTGRLVRTCTSARNGFAASGALLAAAEAGADPEPGVIWSSAVARYSAWRRNVNPRLIASATAKVPKKTRKRRRFPRCAGDGDTLAATETPR